MSTARSSSEVEKIVIDMCEVKGKIKESPEKIFTDFKKGITITRYPENAKEHEKKELYFINITFKESNFKGVVGKELKKDSFGYYKYIDTGDEYFGFWKNDLKSGLGIYYYEKDKKEFYIGDWLNDNREGKGVYFWNMDKKGAEKEFTCVIASFENDSIKSDEEYIKIHYKEGSGKKNITIYKGKFDNDGNRIDKGILIENNMIYDGEFKKDIPNEGRILIFGENDSSFDKIEHLYELKKNDEGKEGDDDYDFEYRTDEEKDKEMKNKIQTAYKELVPKIFELKINKEINNVIENSGELKKMTEEEVENLFYRFNEIKNLDW